MITYVSKYGDFGARKRPFTDLISPRLHTMTDSQLSSSGAAKAERTSVVRVALWTIVGVALVLGVVLFFRYTRLITPLL